MLVNCILRSTINQDMHISFVKSENNFLFQNIQFLGVCRVDGDIYRFHLSKLYYVKARITSENFIKIGS